MPEYSLRSPSALTSALLNSWKLARLAGRKAFMALFILVSVGVTADLVVIVNLLSWLGLKQMSGQQLFTVVLIDLAAVFLIGPAVGYWLGRRFWDWMERLFQRELQSRSNSQDIAVTGRLK